jgi:hypothetical protein
MGQCEECLPEEGVKEIVSHGLCAKHNQRRLRTIWRKPEPSDTQKQKLMEKLEKDLINIKNMCSRWERDGYVAMKLITAETIETFRMELDDYMDFRPTLKAAEPLTELDQTLAGQKAPAPMFDDEDAATAAKKATPGQYQFAPVVEKNATPKTAAPVSKQAKESVPVSHKATLKNDEGFKGKTDESGGGTSKAGKPPQSAPEGQEIPSRNFRSNA